MVSLQSDPTGWQFSPGPRLSFFSSKGSIMSLETSLDRRAALVLGGSALLAAGTAGLTVAQDKKADKLKRVKEAVKAMKGAKEDIEKGGGFGGHKKKAVEALDAAIKELEEAIKYVEG